MGGGGTTVPGESQQVKNYCPIWGLVSVPTAEDYPFGLSIDEVGEALADRKAPCRHGRGWGRPPHSSLNLLSSLNCAGCLPYPKCCGVARLTSIYVAHELGG